MPDAVKERHFTNMLLSSLELKPDEIDDGKEKPDVRILLSDRRIGIEVTEATPEEYVRGSKALIGSGWNGCISTTNWQHRPNRRPTQELLAEGTDIYGNWADSAESFERWKGRIMERLFDKKRAFSRPEFGKLDENWLLIADVEASQITHMPQVIEAARFFHDLAQKFKPASYFDCTFILFGLSFFIKWDHRTSQIDFVFPDGRIIQVA
jgi:hypothetical protein